MTQDPISLWQLLEKYRIVIPIIQRDYAQGRCGEGMDVLRNRFLGNLKDALRDSGKPVKLDFLYGNVDNSDFLPLDGQQRLTTLWLLYWLIAFRAGKLTDADVRERLLNFTYNTRSSAKQFCGQLVEEFSGVNANEVGDIATYIRNRKWYYRSYNDDPTIRAMLVMLAGDRQAKPDNGLEQFFPVESTPFEDYWNKLVNIDCPICFYLLSEGIPMSDDFYIKMNARGKPLTPFENFKAELVDYEPEKGKKYFDHNNPDDFDFISKLDNDWMQLFWRYKHPTLHRVDEIYFLFVRQYMLGCALSTPTETKQGNEEKDPKVIADTLLRDNFYSIEDYAGVLTEDFKSRIFKTLNKIVKYNEMHAEGINKHISELASWLSSDFHFLPEYKSKEDNDFSVYTLSHRDRVIFFGLCLFFENYPISDTNQTTIDTALKDWIRFCWNICNNPLVDSDEGEKSAVQLLRELAQKGYYNSVYDRLAENKESPKLNSQAAKAQREEEWQKARFQANDSGLKERFEEAEHHAFFDGSIRFLLWNENGEYTVDYFESKFATAKDFFPAEKQYKRDSRIQNSEPFQNYFCACLNAGDRNFYGKLGMIITNTTNSDRCILFDGHGYNWKIMLNKEGFASATHAFLTQEPQTAKQLRESLLPRLKEAVKDKEQKYENQEYKDRKRLEYVSEVVLEDNFIENLNEKLPDIVKKDLFLRTWNEWALYPVNAGDKNVIVLGTSRNRVLYKLEKDNLVTSPYAIKPKESSIHFGKRRVPFCYRENNFIWTYNGDIYLEDKPELKDYVDFDATSEDVIKILDALLEKRDALLGNE